MNKNRDPRSWPFFLRCLVGTSDSVETHTHCRRFTQLRCPSTFIGFEMLGAQALQTLTVPGPRVPVTGLETLQKFDASHPRRTLMNAHSLARNFSRDFDSSAGTFPPRHRSIMGPRLFNQSGRERAARPVTCGCTQRDEQWSVPRATWRSLETSRVGAAIFRNVSVPGCDRFPERLAGLNFLRFHRRRPGHSQLLIFY